MQRPSVSGANSNLMLLRTEQAVNPYFLPAKPVIDRAKLNSRRHAGLSFWVDQTMLNGSTSSASSR